MPSLSSGALGNTRFRLLLTGQTISELGSAMFPVALVGLVLVEHGPGTVQAAGVAGPAAAGALLAFTDLTVVFLVDAATFLASIAALALLGEPKVAAPDGPGDRRGSFRLGLGEVTKRPWVVAIIAIATFQAPLTIAPGFTPQWSSCTKCAWPSCR